MTNIGHNNPPSPFDEHKEAIEGLYEEAGLWLDGEEVTTEETASKISDLVNMLRKAKTAADKSRKEEKQPHLDAGKAVDAKYKEIATKADTAIDTCKKALQPYLEEQERIKREAEREARERAEAAEQAAREAMQKAQADNLEEREQALQAADEAAKAKNLAQKVSNTRINTKSSQGRAVGLRTTRVPVITNLREAAAYYWGTEHGKAAFEECIMKLARQDMKEVPGIVIREERSVA